MSSILAQCRNAIKKLAFGDTLLPQEFTIGLTEPQEEVSLWLHGVGLPRDVTQRQSTACTAPLSLCVAFHPSDPPTHTDYQNAVLKFTERDGRQRVLGEIRLRFRESIFVGTSEFVLFHALGSVNHCLPRFRLWAHYLLQAWSQRRRNDDPDIRMTLLEERAASVTFIRPHFLYLGSVGDEKNGNIFPMNLLGDLGNGYFGFALREQRRAAHLVERAGHVAVSGIPLSRCAVLFQLVGNHKKASIDWKQLPFETRDSTTFGIPIPRFASRVREMQIERVHKVGSHRFFIARVVSDQRHEAGLQACVVHGFYQHWRLNGHQASLRASLAQDSINKRGV